jgi:DHA1 family bicyclomycin/chloramphenicol resistance-like MFS transporter
MSTSPARQTYEQTPRRWIVALATIVAIGPMSIDMYLPALPALQAHFGTDTASTQLTLALFFIGLAVGQLVYGPLSDRIGRRKPLIIGMTIYIAASLGCAFAPSMDALILLRLLQALGGCAGMVVSRAMVRDRFEPQDMAKILSALVLVMGLAPILAPMLGGQVFHLFGWQAIFIALALFGLLCLLLGLFALPETLAVPTPVSVRSALQNYRRLLGHRRFMGYALSGGVAQGGMFAYISVSAFVFIDVYHLTPLHFSWLFGANAAGLILAAQLNSRLLKYFPAQVVLRFALRSNAFFGGVMLLAVLGGVGGIWGLVVPLFLAISSLGLSFPNSSAAAMAPFGDRAGAASALMGTLQFGVAACSGILAGHFHDGTAVPMAAMIAACGLSSTLLLRVLVGPPPQLPEAADPG